MPDSILQLGAVAIIFLIAIREFFAYLKIKKSNNSDFSEQIFHELQKMNENHLHELKEIVEQGNNRLIDTIHQDNVKIIELLGEIKGRLR